MRQYNQGIVYTGFGTEQILKGIIGEERYNSAVGNLGAKLSKVKDKVQDTLVDLLNSANPYTPVLAYPNQGTYNNFPGTSFPDSFTRSWKDFIYFAKRNRGVHQWRVDDRGRIVINYGGGKSATLDPRSVRHTDDCEGYVAKKIPGVRDKPTIRKIANELRELGRKLKLKNY